MQDDALAKQGEAGAAVHLDRLDFIDDALDPAQYLLVLRSEIYFTP